MRNNIQLIWFIYLYTETYQAPTENKFLKNLAGSPSNREKNVLQEPPDGTWRYKKIWENWENFDVYSENY